jgi:tripartite ATP-independent transporter DctP family solute receptor
MWPIRIIVALAALAGTAAHSKELRSADVYTSDYPTVQAVAYMGQLVRERTDGRHTISLGQSDKASENYAVAELRNGTLDMARINLSVFDHMVPSAIIPSLPYLFNSTAHLRRTLDGPVGDKILADLESQGVIGLCFYDMGTRSFAAKKPIRNVSDMNGMKVRVQPGNIWSTIVQTMGAEPVAIPIINTAAALQTNAVDAADNTLPAYVALRHYEVARFYSLTEHSMAPAVLVFSKRTWDELSKEDRAIIRAAAKESVPYMRKKWEEHEAAARATAQAVGAQIVTDVDRKSFSDVLTPLYATLVTDPELQDMVKQIQTPD